MGDGRLVDRVWVEWKVLVELWMKRKMMRSLIWLKTSMKCLKMRQQRRMPKFQKLQMLKILRIKIFLQNCNSFLGVKLFTETPAAEATPAEATPAEAAPVATEE